MECIHRKENIKMDAQFYPDIKVYCMDGTFRMAHKIIVSRLSHLLESVLKCNQEEEDLAIILPDVPYEMIDLMLELAYVGSVGGLALNNISQVRDVCRILDITQSDFVVRSEDKTASSKSSETSASTNQEAAKSEATTKSSMAAKQNRIKKPSKKHRQKSTKKVLTRNVFSDGESDNDFSVVVDDTRINAQEESSNSFAPEFSENRSKNQQGAFQCESCNKTFIFAKSFERHQEVCQVRLAQGGIKRPKPRKCKTKRSKQEQLLSDEENENLINKNMKSAVVFKFQHYEEKDDEYFCKFPGCTYKSGFKSLENCKNHQLLLHASDKQKLYPCDVCTKKFASNRLRNKHINLMHNKRFECDICGKKCSEQTQLNIHKRIHTGEKPFQCQLCSYSCTQRSNLRKHHEIRHSSAGGNTFSCDICDASFNTKSNLTRHKRLHEKSELSIICEQCGKKFKDKGGLNQHMFSHGPAEFNCSQCDAKFTSPLYLFRHTSRKHPAGGIQPFTCQLCNKGFPVKHQLQIHIQAVHEKLKHSCPYCNQLMGRKNSLYRHLKTGKCAGMTTTDGIATNDNLNEENICTEDENLHELEPLTIAGDTGLEAGNGQVSIENNVSVLNLDPDCIPVVAQTGEAGGQVEICADDVISGLADIATLTGGVQPNGVGNVVATSTQPPVGPNIAPSYQMLVAQQFIIYPKPSNASSQH